MLPFGDDLVTMYQYANNIIQNMENTVTFILLGVLSVADIVLFWLVFDVRKKVEDILGGGTGSLEEALKTQRERFKEIEHDIIGIRSETSKLKDMAEPAIQKVGMVRFNPFGNVGGDHSSSVALLDSKDNGVVLSSLYLRDGTRTYFKPVVAGKSEYQLSDEEKQALEKAMRGQV
jgi:hypothetical protein